MSHHHPPLRAGHGRRASFFRPGATERRRCAHLTLMAALIWSGGCSTFTSTAESRAPLKAEALAQIKIGQTTAAEVARMLGSPHSIVRGNAHFRESGGPMYYCLSPTGWSDPYTFSQERHLTSLDDAHYAFLYKYDKTQARSVSLEFSGSTERRKVSFCGQEVLIILDNQRNVVTDMAVSSDRPSRPTGRR